MVEATVRDGKVQLRRSEKDKLPLLQRLNRIEGQVRGLKAMIEEDRYCLDEIQQINAINAALREVGLAIIAEHVDAGIKEALQHDLADAIIEDVMRVLRAAMRQGS